MTSHTLQGRTVLVTGSTQGVGASIALAAARAGAQVVLHGLNDDEHAQETCRLIEDLGALAGIAFGDLSDPMPGGVEQLFDSAINMAPGIDLLVNNAGGYFDQPFLEMDFETFDRTMKLNVYSGFLLTQQFARKWSSDKTAGRVLFVGSINGRLAEPMHAAYDTSKGAVEAMIRTLCVSLAPLNIRVNGVAPGLFVTPLTSEALSKPEIRSWMEIHTPNGQVPGPEVCGDAAVFLLGDAADHIHGHMLMVDGGMSVWQQPDPPEQWRN